MVVWEKRKAMNKNRLEIFISIAKFNDRPQLKMNSVDALEYGNPLFFLLFFLGGSGRFARQRGGISSCFEAKSQGGRWEMRLG